VIEHASPSPSIYINYLPPTGPHTDTDAVANTPLTLAHLYQSRYDGMHDRIHIVPQNVTGIQAYIMPREII